MWKEIRHLKGIGRGDRASIELQEIGPFFFRRHQGKRRRATATEHDAQPALLVDACQKMAAELLVEMRAAHLIAGRSSQQRVELSIADHAAGVFFKPNLQHIVVQLKTIFLSLRGQHQCTDGPHEARSFVDPDRTDLPCAVVVAEAGCRGRTTPFDGFLSQLDEKTDRCLVGPREVLDAAAGQLRPIEGRNDLVSATADVLPHVSVHHRQDDERKQRQSS